MSRRLARALGLGIALAAVCGSSPVAAWELSGSLALEVRGFFVGGGERDQAGANRSLAFEPELYHSWDDGSQNLVVTPFVRWDEVDEERSHFDLRELYWQKVGRDWELSVGWRKVFWGVTESAHLVDVINQTDLVEDPDGEQKLGQPMAQLTLIRNWGNIDLFLLPGFRERTFPGREGRLGTLVPVDEDRALYESEDGDDHVDWAIRWSHSIGPWDLGLSHFSGTSREPRLDLLEEVAEPVLVPFYELVDQTGVDVQGTFGAWLLKLEAISVRGGSEPYERVLGGFEFTFFDLASSGIDLGWLLELSGDNRQNRPETTFVGTRLTFNDRQGTELLAGAIVSASDGALLNLEASRRLGESWRLNLRIRGFSDIPPNAPLRDLREDDYFQVELVRFF